MTDTSDATRRSLLAAAAAGASLAAAGAAEAKSKAKAKAPAEPPMVMEETSLQLRLEHVFDIRIDFGPRWLTEELPWGGKQGYTPIGRAGLVRGPRLNGIVMERSGADYANVRADGVVEFEAHYFLQADDGTPIYIENIGYGSGLGPRPEGAPAPYPGAGYFRSTPRFRVAAGPHDWLTRTIIVGGGERKPGPPDHTIFRYYAVL